jgi:hypothetical protein
VEMRVHYLLLTPKGAGLSAPVDLMRADFISP